MFINLLKQPTLLRVTFLLAVGLLTAFARTGARLKTGARRAGPASARENFGRKTGKRREPHARLTNGRTMKEEPKFTILNVDDDEASRYAISRILETYGSAG
ncbi:MAG: hypothetical protein JSU86_01940 [Phycisphaerales bacterium]|nr:MAG: hypothetical protein JSU86_01940 [Phycisphaerales bacterium]